MYHQMSAKVEKHKVSHCKGHTQASAFYRALKKKNQPKTNP